MRRRELIGTIVLLVGCGRFGFEPAAGDGSLMGDVATGDGQTADDAPPCAAGDGVCRASCVGVDPDCSTTCGDGICVGNAGELCTSCDDCKTMDVVCGNGACQAGEDSDACYADCGPTPWPWTAEEDELLVAINSARTTGVVCPGGGGVLTAAVLTRNDAGLDAGAREWAWELAYHQLTIGDSCNGRTATDRMYAAGVVGQGGAWLALGQATPQAIVDSWLANTSACPSVMDAANTRIGIGVGVASTRGIAIILD